jgi:type I restriction enzyme M protein
MLGELPATLYRDPSEFTEGLASAVRRKGVRSTAPLRCAILDALGERDEQAAICRDEEGNPSRIPTCATPKTCRSAKR